MEKSLMPAIDEIICIPCPSCGYLLNECWITSVEGVAKLKCADCNTSIEADYKNITHIEKVRIVETVTVNLYQTPGVSFGPHEIGCHAPLRKMPHF